MRTLNRFAVCTLSLLAFAGLSSAAENKLMHCFAFTAIEGATDADWKAFYQATDALPGKIPGLTKVWYGKLRNPMYQFAPDAETRKKFTKDVNKATGDIQRIYRQYGVCMEMTDEAALKAYVAAPAKKEWDAIYAKVRVPGTTTFDIMPTK
jgi:hypothetical protein